MKEQFLLYGVCLAISIGAVAITSILKIIACAVARRCGKTLSGNVKEYIFTPIALLLAAGALYLWLDRFMRIQDEQLFILLIVCFSVGTMLIYWLLFQPTRKAAKGIIRAIAQYFHAEPIVNAAQDVLTSANVDEEKNDITQEKENSPSQTTSVPLDADGTPKAADSEADKLRAMVEAIKKR